MVNQEIKILVIDDHPFFLEGLKLGLESSGNDCQNCYLLDTLTSPFEALKKLLHTASYDLILCDLHLPDMNGINFIQNLFKKDIWIPVAIISASENISDIELALKTGASGFINKALNKNELKIAIRKILLGTTYTPPSYTFFKNSGKNLKDIFTKNAERLGITNKQFQVLTYMGQGLSNKEISDKMDISTSTVKTHSQALFQTLHVKNRTACILNATKLQLLPESHLLVDKVS